MNRDVVRQASNIVALIATVIFNWASQVFELNGNTNQALANRYDILYFPADWAFSIWGIIYTLLIAWVIYQALPSQRGNPYHRRIGYLFVVTAAANIGWIASFHYEQFALSMVMMLLLLVTLIAIVLRLGTRDAAVPLRDRWLIHIPFSVYLGWITAATVTNATYLLYDAGYRESVLGIGGEAWTVILLLVSAALAIMVIITRRDTAYALVIAWAVSAIGSRYLALEIVAGTAFFVAAAILIVIVINWMFSGPSAEGTATVGSSYGRGHCRPA
jgi:translocator protein